MLRKGDVKMRKRFLMKVVSFSFLAMCSGFITHTVKAEERPSVEVQPYQQRQLLQKINKTM